MANDKNDGQLNGILKKIRQTPRLNPEEEKRLFRAIAFDSVAKRKLIDAYLYLVLEIAEEFYKSGQDLQKRTLNELFQEGLEGLFRALEKYSPKKDYHFADYARWWIRQTLIESSIKGGDSDA